MGGRGSVPEELEAKAELKPFPLSQGENQIVSKHMSRNIFSEGKSDRFFPVLVLILQQFLII